MFEGIKKAYHDRQNRKQEEREFERDIAERDRVYREEARKQARSDFLEDRKIILDERRKEMVSQESAKYDKQRDQLRDTRTTGDKFKGGMKKLGNMAKKVGTQGHSAGKQMGQGAKSSFGGMNFDVSRALGQKATQATTKSKKKCKKNTNQQPLSMSDRILRNL